MASLSELARLHTSLEPDQIEHLQRLVRSWSLLADFCFADLMLYARVGHPVGGEVSERFIVLGHIRPTTSQTLYRADWVGRVVGDHERPLVARSFGLGEIIDGEVPNETLRELVRALCIPVRFEGETIGVLVRESAPSLGRPPGELERAYVEVFHRFARMIVNGEFPFPPDANQTEEVPRVGDGVLLLDSSARVEYASPNAVSALHRLAIHANTEGMRLLDLGLQEAAVRTAFARGRPAAEEVEQGPEVTVAIRCIPLLDHGTVTGAVLLLRDVSDVRRRDRLLLSKDATIREIHHRVKNNLQTISSLLRLQGRRLSSPEAKAALEESVRRIRSIALVHETLSHEPGDELPFIDIVRPLVRMVEEGLISRENPVDFKVTGQAGLLPANIATPLAVVLTELLQNVVDHAYPDSAELRGGLVTVELANRTMPGRGGELLVRVVDDGVGLPPDFRLESSTGLGLSIVRTLIMTELHGTIEMRSGDGTLPSRPGTVVELRVPLHEVVYEEPATGPVPVVRVDR
jgi:two-component sensor histidine kinase